MDEDLNNISTHCLDNLLSATEQSGLHVAEDIYDSAGVKLLSTGYALSDKTRERLINRKLKKPLETSLRADNTVTREEISIEALRLLETMPVLSRLSPFAAEEARQLRFIDLQPLSALLITVMRDNGTNSYQHMVLLTLLCRLIGRKMKLDSTTMQILTMAAQTHDIGELYVPREHLYTRRRLTPQEWRNVMVHPLIGRKALMEHTNYPKAVAQAVFEHHERADGSGYPRKLKASEISMPGQVLIVAEVLAGMLTKPDFPMQRALLVFRLLAGEYPFGPLSALHEMVKVAGIELEEADHPLVDTALVRPAVQSLDTIKSGMQILLDKQLQQKEQIIVESSQNRLIRLRQAVISIGLEHCLIPEKWGEMKDDPMIRLEVEVTAREIAWRIRDLARDMILELLELEHQPSDEFQALIDSMTQTTVA